MAATTSNQTSCVELPLLIQFSAVYAPIHAYVALTVCVFGSATNFLNAIVLLQKSMRSPTNALLTGIALVDSVTMIAYGIHTVYLYMLTSPDPNSYPHGSFTVRLLLLQHVLSIGSHTVSTVLVVELAAFRCWVLYTVTMRSNVASGVTTARAGGGVGGVSRATQHRVVAAGLLTAGMFGILMSLPPFFIYTVAPTGQPEPATNETHLPTGSVKQSYWFEVRTGARPLESAHFVLYGCFVKILASILICILTGFILIAMEIARRRYVQLQTLSARLMPSNSNVSKCPAVTQIEPVSARASPTQYSSYRPERNSLVAENYQHGAASAAPPATMQQHQQRRGRRRRPESISQGDGQIADRLSKKTRQSQRATIMLIVVVVSFVITEAPQGVFNTLVAVKGECFHSTVYVPLGDVLDLAVLLNSSINFILYCSMSQMFRANFARLICQLCPCCVVVCCQSRSGSSRGRARQGDLRKRTKPLLNPGATAAADLQTNRPLLFGRRDHRARTGPAVFVEPNHSAVETNRSM